MIARYCRDAWRQTNTQRDGTRYQRHRPYAIPEIAAALVSALGIHDDEAREHEIKRLFELERTGAWTLI